MRHGKLAFGVFLGVLLIGSSALGLSNAGQAPAQTGIDAPEREAEETGAGHEGPGGTIERFHQAGACDVVDVAGLGGNWTHGSYVSAVAALGDPGIVPVAAHSDCGKPRVATGDGNGPPTHALAHVDAGRGDDDGTEGGDSEAQAT